MLRQLLLSITLRPAVLGLLAGVLLVGSAHAGDPDSPDASIRAQLESGEFAPALAAARAMATPEQRDAILADVAVAQAEAGARDASLQTAAEIYDDRVRTRAISQATTQPWGRRGGSGQADFESLMDLIVATVEPLTWDDSGGPGSIAEFFTGVYVDGRGVLTPLLKGDEGDSLAVLRAESAARGSQDDARRGSPLRKVSLSRLEKHVQLRQAAGRQPTEAMEVLAGLQRIRYVFVYPESGDVVLAGPAGDWCVDPENRIVSTETGQPVLRLDDLVVVLRRMTGGGDTSFGCLIVPPQEALARLKALVDQPDAGPAGDGRKAWVERFRAALGKQDIEVQGLDPRTRAAQVMVEADYRMKLVGMGIEEGVPGVKSYLDLIEVRPGEYPPPMGVLRWWFTLDYDAVLVAEDRQAFAIRGQGVKVLSENELLTARGERVHTGDSEPLNREFARSFTEHFEALAAKYPVYADLRNVCDLALVGALIRSEDLAERTGWHMTFFGDPEAYRPELGPAPKQVETVANFRVIRSGTKIHTIAGVSGGVRVDPAGLVATSALEVDHKGELGRQHGGSEPARLPPDAWWWD